MSTRDPLTPRRATIDGEDLTIPDTDAGADPAVLGRDADDATGVGNDQLVAADGAEPYFPPTDPPVVPGEPDNADVVQGFAPTSDWTDDGRAPGAGDITGADDDTLADRVMRRLRGDAATSTLEGIAVEARDGVVYLRGTVQGLDDGDLAVDVASRVPGVREVVDATSVEGL